MSSNRNRNIRVVFFLISVIGVFWAWVIHQANYKYVKSMGLNAENGFIHTADDPSYLAPGKNYYEHGVWKDNTQGLSSYVQRPPGIGLIHFIALKIQNEKPYVFHKMLHLILHGCSIYILGLCFLLLSQKQWHSILGMTIYAFFPCFWGYLFYYLSEALTPSILIFLIYGYLKYQDTSESKWLIFQAVINCILLLLRPQLGILCVPFLFFLVKHIRIKGTLAKLMVLLALLIGFGAWSVWEIRTLRMAGKWEGLHPIYDVTNNTQYRPIHGSFTSLYKVWDYNSARFHSHMVSIWYNSGDSILLERNIEKNLGEIPSKVFTFLDRNELAEDFRIYNMVSKELVYYENNNLPAKGETELEESLRLKIDSTAHALRGKMWMESNILVPVNSAKFLLTKSQLNLAIFQIKYRGLWWMELFRYISVLLINLTLLLSILNLVNSKKPDLFLLSLSIIIYLFYLFFIQKMNEERYLMPLLPILLVMSFGSLRTLRLRFTNKT